MSTFTRIPASPTKGQRHVSLPFPRLLQDRDVNLMMHTHAMDPTSKDASRRHGVYDGGVLDTPPPSSPSSGQERSGHQRSSSITLPYSSSPPRSTESSPELPSSPVKGTKRPRPSLPLAPLTSTVEASDPHAGLEAVADGVVKDGCTHVLYGSFTHGLMLGRCKPSGEAHNSSAGDAGTELDPADLELFGSKPSQHVALPNTARHVSRKHAIVEWLPFSPVSENKGKRPIMGGFVVRILGQNGLIVDGRRRREGHVLRLEPGRSTIDFFGVKTRFEVRPRAQKPRSLLEAEAQEHAASQNKKPRPTWPTDGSSPLKRSDMSRSPSLSGCGNSVAKLLSHKKNMYVKQSTLGPNSQLPPSPPSSSPTRGHFGGRRIEDGQHLDDTTMQSDGADEPSSPTLGRGGRALHLPALPQTAGLAATSDDSLLDSAARLQALGRGETNLDIELAPSPVDKLVQEEQADASMLELASDAESELTPSPTPSPQPKPQTAKKDRAGQQPKESLPEAAPAVSRGRPLALTNSQTQMPPPNLPASAKASSTVTASKIAPLRDTEGLRNALRDRARQCVARIAPTYDLEGLLAGAVVFHRTATISASEAVRSVLAGTQGMMRGEAGNMKAGGDEEAKRALTYGETVPGWGAEDLLVKRFGMSAGQAAERWSSIARRAWTEQLEIQLQSKAMFGQIQRAGKDASGNSLECWYYYNKDGDEDTERAANLGALAKPIRGALKTHKPIFWKKSAYPRSADEEAQADSNAGDSTAARAYNSAWKDDREWDLFTDSQISPAIVSTPTSSIAARTQDAKTSTSTTARTSMGIDEKRIWEETQPEERERTWDRVGDMDWSSSAARSSPAASSSQGSAKRRKRAPQSMPRE